MEKTEIYEVTLKNLYELNMYIGMLVRVPSQ